MLIKDLVISDSYRSENRAVAVLVHIENQSEDFSINAKNPEYPLFIEMYEWCDDNLDCFTHPNSERAGFDLYCSVDDLLKFMDKYKINLKYSEWN